MAYTPRNVPSDPAALPDFLRSEFQRLQEELGAAQALLRIAEINVDPSKPRQGDIRLADGTNWDPIADGLQQPVWFDGTQWQPFGYPSYPSSPYDAGGYYPSTPGSSVMMTRHVFTRAVTFPVDLTGSQGDAETAATSDTNFDLQKNGVSFGTMTFAAAATTATFTCASGASFSAGDVLTVIAPGTPDATLADIGWMLKGVRT